MDVSSAPGHVMLRSSWVELVRFGSVAMGISLDLKSIKKMWSNLKEQVDEQKIRNCEQIGAQINHVWICISRDLAQKGIFSIQELNFWRRVNSINMNLNLQKACEKQYSGERVFRSIICITEKTSATTCCYQRLRRKNCRRQTSRGFWKLEACSSWEPKLRSSELSWWTSQPVKQARKWPNSIYSTIESKRRW